jgi:hypothetical protein
MKNGMTKEELKCIRSAAIFWALVIGSLYFIAHGVGIDGIAIRAFIVYMACTFYRLVLGDGFGLFEDEEK